MHMKLFNYMGMRWHFFVGIVFQIFTHPDIHTYTHRHKYEHIDKVLTNQEDNGSNEDDENDTLLMILNGGW